NEIVQHAIFGRLKTAYRKSGEIGLREIDPEAWAAFRTQLFFMFCTLPGEIGVTSFPIFVSRSDLESLTRPRPKVVAPGVKAGTTDRPIADRDTLHSMTTLESE